MKEETNKTPPKVVPKTRIQLEAEMTKVSAELKKARAQSETNDCRRRLDALLDEWVKLTKT